MKRIAILFTAFIAFSLHAGGQVICDRPTSSTPLTYTGNGYVSNGGVFTPKGCLRILVVFISYGEPYDSQEVDGWPADSPFPNWATSADEPAFYTSYSDFSDNIYSDNNRFSVSNFYYQMSMGNFKLIADYYPQRVVVDVDRKDRWKDIHKKAIQQIKDHVDWSLYDNRTNSPSYLFDNSVSTPDGIIDYIVFCHRFSWNWQDMPSDSLTSQGANGFSSTNLSNLNMNNGYFVGKCGFSFLTGGSKPIGIFPHEIGHELYDGPHYAGGNGVAGEYFYEPKAGWGMMHLSQSHTCAAGWERYILDWNPEIRASGHNSDIKGTSDLSATNGIFTLRDFITTGDAIRIQVPSESGTHQYLWIENHQCQSTFDGNVHGTTFCDSPIAEYKRGIIAYVESYSHVKDTNRVELFKNANGIRWISAEGDFDYTFDQTPIYPTELCNPYEDNATFALYKGLPNPIGGQNNNESIRHDFDNSGFIGYNKEPNSPRPRNEQTEVVQIDNELPTAKYFTGSGLQFHCGDKVGIARNPCVRNTPKYDEASRKMGDYFINGISFEILSQNADGSMVVSVKVDDIFVDRDTRWAASSIVLKDITGDGSPDIDILPSVTVNIDKSGTPNRHKNPANENQTSSTIDDFITPTTFTCSGDSYFRQEPGSTVNVKKSSSLVLEAGALYEIETGAVLNIKATGVLHVKSGATLKVKGTGHVEIHSGAYLCIEDGATIELANELSAINLRQGYQTGLNPELGQEQSNCTSNPLVGYPLTAVSEGNFHEFGSNRFIQDTTYYGSAFDGGNTVKVGYNVTTLKTYGNVIFENGSHVIIDAEDEVLLKSGVIVKQGAILEVR